jgi:hypothetical protein
VIPNWLATSREEHGFATDAKLARIAGSAPIPASTGSTIRHRLDRGGNRQINCAVHRLALTKSFHDPDTADYLARKQAEGKTRREAFHCLKRHLACRVWHLFQPAATTQQPATTIHCNTSYNSFSVTYRYENLHAEARRRRCPAAGLASPVPGGLGLFVGERRSGRPRFAPWAASPLT